MYPNQVIAGLGSKERTTQHLHPCWLRTAASRFDSDTDCRIFKQRARRSDPHAAITLFIGRKKCSAGSLPVTDEPYLILLTLTQRRQSIHYQSSIPAIRANDNESSRAGSGICCDEGQRPHPAWGSKNLQLIESLPQGQAEYPQDHDQAKTCQSPSWQETFQPWTFWRLNWNTRLWTRCPNALHEPVFQIGRGNCSGRGKTQLLGNSLKGV